MQGRLQPLKLFCRRVTYSIDHILAITPPDITLGPPSLCELVISYALERELFPLGMSACDSQIGGVQPLVNKTLVGQKAPHGVDQKRCLRWVGVIVIEYRPRFLGVDDGFLRRAVKVNDMRWMPNPTGDVARADDVGELCVVVPTEEDEESLSFEATLQSGYSLVTEKDVNYLQEGELWQFQKHLLFLTFFVQVLWGMCEFFFINNSRKKNKQNTWIFFSK